MRLFFGFDLEPGDKAAIADWRDRHAAASGRPVPPANFHITLAFLGDLDTRVLEHLCDKMDALCTDLPSKPLVIKLDRVGYWPSPRIYWLGTSADCDAIKNTARKLQFMGQAFGSRRERLSFTPHITLYRGCERPPPAPLTMPLITLALREVVLFESKQGRSAVSYTPLAAWPLTGNP
ncbi:RNA 2',3'-cyclic phosphodiesterase [Congregibacter variabilis]|uniref:RNA 2',3'-cyclic phosphodiesterase n=1 Tax=Congregibacter variabilis TaxID=3081200 RepID=A0ABZ0HYS8_9GAMM|nr:RNA 2',3'-cyclic phosphodiesterase [Congregibacter sp. IMCC43200]